MKYKVQAFRTAHIIETADFEVEADSSEQAEIIALEYLADNDGAGGSIPIHFELGDSVGSDEWEMEPAETDEVAP